MEILAANQRQDDAVGVQGFALFEDIRSKYIVAEGAAAPDRDLLRDLLLENGANIANRNGVYGHDDFYRFHTGEIILGSTPNLMEMV